MKRHILFALVVTGLWWGSPAAAQELKLKAPISKKLDPNLMEKRARDAVNGYYDALIQARYDQAGSFAHADAIEPVRKKLLELIQHAPAAQRAATLKNLGAPDVTFLQSQTVAQFFANYARSTYAANIQALAKPERKAHIKITEVKCKPARSLCEVTFDLYQTLNNGKEVHGTNYVRVSAVDGRWLVGEGLGRKPSAP